MSERKYRRPPEDPLISALRNMIHAHEEDEKKDLDRRFDELGGRVKIHFEEVATRLLHPLWVEIQDLKKRVSELESKCSPLPMNTNGSGNT